MPICSALHGCVLDKSSIETSASFLCQLGERSRCDSHLTWNTHTLLQVHGAPVKEHSEFVNWLHARGEDDTCHALTVGMSDHGRALFAARPIQVGERVLRVSLNLMITPDKLPAEVIELLPAGVSEWARLALFILAEQHRGETSQWAPYIRCLPPPGTLHSTVFWKKEELDMVRFTSLHRETMQRKAVIASEFASVLPVLQKCPHIFGERVLHSKFKQAYAIGKLQKDSLYACKFDR